MTIQRRLTVAFVALIAVVVAGLGAFEAIQLRGFLIESAAVRLRAQAKPTIEARFQDGESVRAVAGSLAVDLNSRYTGALVYHRAGDVTLPPADPVDAPPPLPVPLIPLRQAFNGEKEAIAEVEASYGGRMLAVFIPLPPMPAATEQRAEAVAVLGESLAGVDDVVRQHALIAALNLVIACGLGGLVGPVLIRRALRPLRRIAGTTKRIAAGDLSQRVDLTGPDDEIGELSRSFDHMAASLEHAFTELADSEARVRSFVADASHELRTPLTALGGYADVLLRDGTDPEGARRLLVGLRREVSRMQRLVDDLLTLARLDAGAPLELASTDLRELAGEVAEQLRPLAGTRDLAVRGPAVIAEVDADRIRQVLVNLVANALRHTSDRGVIGIELGAGASGVRIEVTDDGEGMDEATRARAFTRFARGTDKRSGRGSGLGLAIVHAIVSAHGGGVEIRSAPGEGTAVAVTLPSQSARSAYPTLRTV